MKIERCRKSATHPFRALGLLLLILSGTLLSGCNAGLIGVAIWLALDDDDGGKREPKPPLPSTEVEVVFDRVTGARRDPASTVLSFILRNDDAITTEVRVEYAGEGEPLRPATLRVVDGGQLGDPGVIEGLRTSQGGTLHRVGWDALTDLVGDDSLQEVRVRLTTVSENTDQATVLVGNDAPLIRDLQIVPVGDGEHELSFVLEDSSSDPTDVAVRYTTSAGDIDEAQLEEGTTFGGQVLDTSPDGEAHTMLWRSIPDLGRVDREVQVRVVPTDRVEGFPGKSGDPIDAQLSLENNSPPEVQILSEEILADPDRRRGQAIWFALRDADADAIDAIVQWAREGEPFPELPTELVGDPAAREALLADAEQRQALRIISTEPERIEGTVEEPAAGPLAADEVLATWLLSESELRGLRGQAEPIDNDALGVPDLVGRRVELLGGSGAPQVRRVCSFDPMTGVLSVSEAFDPPPEPGDQVRIDLGGLLLLRSAPEWVRQRVIWASGVDLPGGGMARLRITPYETITALDDRPALACFGEIGFPAENAEGGEAGAPKTLAQPKDLLGPFSGLDPLVGNLFPTDAPAGVAVSDIDENGLPDLVTAVRVNRAAVLLLQTAPGWFDPLRLPDARLGEPTSLTVGDLDGDGDEDIAVVSEQPAALVIFHQSASLDFVSERTSFSPHPLLDLPSAVVSSDLDADGDLDLAIADASDTTSGIVIFYRGDAPAGAAACEAAQNGYSACPVAAPRSAADLVLADVDGDGKDDLVTAQAGGLTVFYQDADGVYDQRVVEVPVEGGDLLAAAVRDADDDGDEDLIALDAAGHRVVLLSQESPDSFVLSTLLDLPQLEAPLDLAIADLQGLGRLDVAVADAGSGAAPDRAGVVVGLADASGTYSSSLLQRDLAGDSPPPSRVLAVADVDLDGVLDIVSAESGDAAVAVYRPDRTGDFTASAEEIAGPSLVSRPSTLAAADFDADGRLDVATLSIDEAADPPLVSAVILLQRADGITDSRVIELPVVGSPGTGEEPTPLALAAADLDGDGRADLALADVDSGAIHLLRQDDAGGFTARVTTLTKDGLEGPESVAIADLDGDGRPDVLTAGRTSDEVVWFRQLSDGEFELAPALVPDTAGGVVLDGPISVIACDLNTDGRLDVVAAGHRSANLVVFYQQETRGTFAPGAEIPLPEGDTGLAPVQVVASDVEGDGDVDLVVAALGSPALVVVHQTEPGVFDALPVTEGLEDVIATALAARDLDGDGAAEVVLTDANQDDPAIHVVRLSSGGEAAEIVMHRSELVDAPAGILAFDLDGDGEADIVSANRASDNLTALRGGR